MEETELMNPPSQPAAQQDIDLRSDKQGRYDPPNPPRQAKQGVFIDYFQKKYWICFSAVLIVLLALLFLHLYLKVFINGQRTDSFERNLKALSQYQQQTPQQKSPDLQEQPYPSTTTSEPNSDSTQPTSTSENNSVVQKKIIHLNSHIYSPPEITKPSPEGPIKENQPTVNNPFFSINLPSFNILQSKGIPDYQPSFSGMSVLPQNPQKKPTLNEQYKKNVEETTIPQITFQNRPDWADYQNYTGIEMYQVSNAVSWMQSKQEPLIANTSAIQGQRAYYEQKYQISQYKQLPFCIVVPSFNNAANNRHINNMNSILTQEYSNYHIVFIDDASTDSTGKDVTKLMQGQEKVPPERYTIIKNKLQMRAMHNLRTAARQHCKPEEIFMVVDGDDELIGRQVLKLFNAHFQKNQYWFVYSNFLAVKHYVGFSRVVPPTVIFENSFRKYPFVTSHLRAFYTQLFRNIKEEDLRDAKGEYLTSANDVAICMPILEQAQQRIYYIPELTYYYNSETGLNNHALRLREQKLNELRLRGKEGYTRVHELFPQPAA